MACTGTLDLVIEFKPPVDKVWKAIKNYVNVGPKVLGQTYKVESVEGNDISDGNGLVSHWKIAPSTVVKGAPEMMLETKRMTKMDDINKIACYSIFDGDHMKFYKSFDVVMTLKPKEEEYDVDEGGVLGSIVTWSAKFEKVNPMVPDDPLMTKPLVAATFYIIDAHLLYSQYI